MPIDITPENYISVILPIIQNRLKAIWIDDEDVILTPIAWPDDRTFVKPNDSAWLELNVLWGDSFSRAFAGDGGLNLNVGVISLKLFAPRGQGMGAIQDLIGTARTAFSNYFGSGLKCEASGLSPVIDEGALKSINISTRFEVYEFQSS